ncbi:STT3 domain-containing protein [Candidatus Altiarchaeota archaeon]
MMGSKRKVTAKKRGRKKDEKISFSTKAYEDFMEKLKEPLVSISLVVLILVSLRLSVESLFNLVPNIIAIAFIASIYFIRKDTKLKTKWKYIIPLLVFITTMFSFYVNWYGFPANRDYVFFSIISAVILFFTSLTLYGAIKWEPAALIALIICSLILHMVPAMATLIGNLDSYWQYKWMQDAYAGHITEYDDLVYPMIGGLAMHDNATFVERKSPLGHGLPQHATPMFNSVFYAVTALMLAPFGFTLYDIAMLLPGVIGGLAIIPMYLLVKEMFSDMTPHNKIAALLAAFMLMLSPGFAINGTAANCEDDVFGMFLMLSGFYLFFASVNRRSFKYAILAGIAFLMLKLTWAYTYAFLTIGTFGVIYALILFFHKENCTRLLPYFVIAIAVSYLSVLFTHEQLNFDIMLILKQLKMPPIALFPLAGAIGLPILLEAVNIRRFGGKKVTGSSIEDRVDRFIHEKILLLSVIVLLGATVVIYMEGGPTLVLDNMVNTVMGAKLKSIVHQTVSEQNPMAGDFADFLRSGYNKYGVALIYGLILIPFMAYLALKKRSVGALFVLTWSIPMMWGSWNKSAWIFASSPSIAALGATIGLYAGINRKELDDWRVLGTIMVLFIPMMYVPMFGIWNYDRFIGYVVMHMALTPDIYQWQPMLDWAYNETSEDDAILTWWDYGHWITAVSKRPVLIDNLQADYYEIQDVARFFVNKTSEEEAFEIVKAYNDAYRENGRELKYVVIDWTLVGKGSALHFIANGDIGSNEPGNPQWAWRNFGQCRFLPQASMLKPQIATDGQGGFTQVQKLFFGCTSYVRGILFTLSNGQVKNIDVVDQYDDLIPWDKWSAKSRASILGVQSLRNVLVCASTWGNENLDPTTNYVCKSIPSFNTLVYVPDEFNDFMLTRLYLSQHADEYRSAGLYTRDTPPLKHFKFLKDFSTGFVRVYEIDYEGFDDGKDRMRYATIVPDQPASSTASTEWINLS